jgi:hypothetical protein
VPHQHLHATKAGDARFPQSRGIWTTPIIRLEFCILGSSECRIPNQFLHGALVSAGSRQTRDVSASGPRAPSTHCGNRQQGPEAPRRRAVTWSVERRLNRSITARHRPPHHHHNKLQLRLACAQAHRGRSARLQALLAWLMLTTYSKPRSSRRTQDRAWNPHQPEIRAVQPQYQRYWAAGRVLPNPNPSRGGL